MPTLIERQEQAIKKMMEPRTSPRRAQKMRRAVLRQYRKAAERLGYTAEQAQAQARDILDMWTLRVSAGEVE